MISYHILIQISSKKKNASKFERKNMFRILSLSNNALLRTTSHCEGYFIVFNTCHLRDSIVKFTGKFPLKLYLTEGLYYLTVTFPSCGLRHSKISRDCSKQY